MIPWLLDGKFIDRWGLNEIISWQLAEQRNFMDKEETELSKVIDVIESWCTDLLKQAKSSDTSFISVL